MKIEREILEKLYVKEGKKQKEIAIILNSSQSVVSYFCKKYKLNEIKKNMKPKNHSRPWTEEEKEYLIEKYGVDSMESIAKHLGRVTRGVIEKSRKMKLGEAKNATEYINAAELGRALGRSTSTIIRWIKNKGLPSVLKTITASKKIHRIDINKFWKWSKNNLNLMKWELYERNSLGAEPKWIDEEIKKYNKNIIKKGCKEWTETELCHLEHYYKQGLKTKEIAVKLDRTQSAIEARLSILNISRKTINLPWQPIEIEMLLKMRKEKVTLPTIADELGRTLGSVTVKNSRLKKQIQA